eukprot:3449308-Rhodomonas_salina.1
MHTIDFYADRSLPESAGASRPPAPANPQPRSILELEWHHDYPGYPGEAFLPGGIAETGGPV